MYLNLPLPPARLDRVTGWDTLADRYCSPPLTSLKGVCMNGPVFSTNMLAWICGGGSLAFPIRIQPEKGSLAILLAHSKGAPDEPEALDFIDAFHIWAVKNNVPHVAHTRDFRGAKRIDCVVLCFDTPCDRCSSCFIASRMA